ncbi:CLUMA_CG021096, isoform A [Clunio marinus]|uniref:CLUMA_CG021096, isoform A n=1 Tax=Clunio marinus TaxID=568069 RepID=A0A1J1J6B8_9DIPT|nr:CLUMA_CG021096, isoform A [Clunio marinus]
MDETTCSTTCSKNKHTNINNSLSNVYASETIERKPHTLRIYLNQPLVSDNLIKSKSKIQDSCEPLDVSILKSKGIL